MKAVVGLEDFEKLDLRVGKIEGVEEIEGADKLYRLQVNIGEEIRTVCAGLKRYYEKGDLIGKNCVIAVNLAPRKMRGIESQGMILAASTESHEKVILISPEAEIEAGSVVC